MALSRMGGLLPVHAGGAASSSSVSTNLVMLSLKEILQSGEGAQSRWKQRGVYKQLFGTHPERLAVLFAGVPARLFEVVDPSALRSAVRVSRSWP